MKLLKGTNSKIILGILISLCTWFLIHSGYNWGLLGDRIDNFLYRYNDLLLIFFLACYLLPLFFKGDKRVLLVSKLTFPVFWLQLVYLILLLIHVIKIPELIFGFIALTVIFYLVRILFVRNRKDVLKVQVSKVIVSVLLIGLSWVWFVPMHVGQSGESPVCKFRFQVFEYEAHDYSGQGDMQDLFIKSIPGKYGMIDFHRKIGGWKEYFGFKRAEYQIDEEYFGKVKE